jgi:TfoX/Sxy family transcriptional regulator of competence genes
MAYDEELARRVRELLMAEPGITEKRMFGGLAMLRNGNMAVAVRGQGGLLVRADPNDSTVLSEPGAALAVMQGRPMPGWVTVEAEAVRLPADLRRWVSRGLATADSLPPKER